MKILVTGSSGFIGRHLCARLASAGHYVVPVDILEGYDARFLDDVPQVSGEKFDVVYHLAANIHNVDLRMRDGYRAYDDILLDYAVAAWIDKHPPTKCFVWPTSCAVDEPSDPYAWVKLTGERVFSRLPCKVAMLRPYSGYGTDQSLEYPFPAILQRAKEKQNPLTVWGSGVQIRDFIHIDDLIEAFLRAPIVFPDKVPIEIGTGIGTSMINLARMMAMEVGYDPIIQPLSNKAQSSPERVADTAAMRALGIHPTVTLVEGIRRALGKCTST